MRVWSVGCATGEEAYSLAMLLLEGVRDLERPVEVQVFASDASETALKKAREGLYPETIVESVSGERLKRFFTQPPGGGYQVSKELREHVVFAQHNLLTDPPFAKLDLVVCRNLLIYLKREVQEEVLELFYYALQPGGYLFLGTSELVADGRRFRTLDKEKRLFQRQRISSAEPRLPKFPLGLPGNGQATPAPTRPRNLSYGDFHARLAERHAPPSVLVTSAFEVVHRSETAGRFLHLPGGEPDDDLVKQVRSELRSELRSALHRAANKDKNKDKGAQSVTTRPVRVTLDGSPAEVALQVRPVDEAERAGFLLVSFLELPAGPSKQAMEAPADEAMAAELELERQRLRAALQEHEGRDEEMRAANEEMQSVNEELRATAEELETSKEELQSMNEELVTFNQENKHKVDELSQLNSDLQNLLSATDIATLFLDRDLRIRRFTPRVSELFNIQRSDRGRPLADLTHKFGYQGLISDAQQVLDTLQFTERELRSQSGAWFLTRTLPYRAADNRIDGVVITLVDISALKTAEATLKTLASRLADAEQRERERIAGVLHDDVQQLLFSLLLKVQNLAKEGGDTEKLQAVEQELRQAVQVIRDLAANVSPPVLRQEGVADLLRWLSNHMRTQHELTVTPDLTLDEEVTLGKERRTLLFNATRELLFNVVKHTDEKHAGIEAFSEDGRVTVIVKDGEGFVKEEAFEQGTGLGLSTLRERFRALGGDLEVASRPNKGTRVTLTLPLE